MRAFLGALLLFGILLPVQAVDHPVLMPQPQEIHYGTGQVHIRGLSIGTPDDAPEDRFAAQTLAGCLAARAGAMVPVATAAASGASVIAFKRTGEVSALPEPGEQAGPESREAYWIKVAPSGIELRGVSSAGLFYAVQTTCQLVEGSGAEAALPEVEIHDWPSLPYRGVMIDTSHGPRPTEMEVKREIDFLARWKNNQYYFYSEASVAIDGYPILEPEAQFSHDEIRRIVAYGRERHVDIVPCMELYGHLHDLFRVERYSDLAIMPHGSEFDPRNPDVANLMAKWVDQITDLFPSRFFHIGFDETGEAPVVAAADKSALYMQQFRLVSGLVRKHNRTLLVWSDMFARYPELIAQIPPGTIVVPWGYDRTVYEPYWKPFENSSLPRFVASGVSVWDQIAPNFDLSFDNIDAFLAVARPHGVTGLINTVWTDDIQVLIPPSFPGLAYGAISAWQAKPVNRATFFADYARLMYKPNVMDDVSAALTALTRAEVEMAKAVGGEWEQTSPPFWDDPLTPAHQARAIKQCAHFHQSRLAAEDATEHFAQALQHGGDRTTLSDLALEARMLDYAGMKNIYAAEMVGYWKEMGAHPDPEKADFYLGECSSHDHSRVQDLMDYSGDLQQAFRTAWLQSYTSYRLGMVMGKWEAEFQRWWKVQRRMRELEDEFHPGEAMPPLESFSSGI